MARVIANNLLAVTNLLWCNRWSVLFILLFPGCSITSPPSSAVLAQLDNPPEDIVKKLDMLTPLTIQWFEKIEAKYLSTGRTLTKDELDIARSVGVTQPQNVRVVILKDFPVPDNPTLLNQIKNYGLGSASEGARTMGNIIMIKSIHKDERWLLAHELAHIAQQEKMGREAFVRRFITEYELVGRTRAPLELDANRISMKYNNSAQ